MSIIEEIDGVNSGADDAKFSTEKVQKSQLSVATRVKNMDTQRTAPNKTSPTSESLLDVMHRRYCPGQYNKQKSEEICIKTDASSRLILKSLQPISRPFYSDIVTCDAQDCSPTDLSPTAAGPDTCKIAQPTGRNLTPLLSPGVPLPSLPRTPGSVSPARPLQSHVSSPESRIYDNLVNVGCADTRNTVAELGEQIDSKQDSGSSFLNDDSNATKTKEDVSSLAAIDGEVEAVEACEWLREAGFPQYAQMYKENQFPIDLKAAEKDHEFLDEDALQTFFRRLDVLNKCSSSKLKRSPAKKSISESDDEEECALSSKWIFQRNSCLWSRNAADLVLCRSNQPDPCQTSINDRLQSTSSRDSVFDSVVETPLPLSASSGVLSPCGAGEDDVSTVTQVVPDTTPNDAAGLNQNLSPIGTAEISENSKSKRPNLFLSPFSSSTDDRLQFVSKEESIRVDRNKDDVFRKTHSHNPSSSSLDLQRIASDKFWRVVSIFRRMEGLKLRKSSRKPSRSELTKKDIGSPVLIESPEILMKIDSLNCTDISPSSENENSFRPSAISVHDSADQKILPVDADAQFLQKCPPSLSRNIPQIIDRRLQSNDDTPQSKTQPTKDGSQENSSNNNVQMLSDTSAPSSASEISGRNPSLGGQSEDLEDAVEIISELLHGVNLEVASASKNNGKRISIYDNVSSEIFSVLQNELDDLLGELYRNIDSLNYSMSKVAVNQRAESPVSSVCAFDEEDALETSPAIPSKNPLVAKDSLAGCETTDGNSSTTPSEGSYNLECAAAKHDTTIHSSTKNTSNSKNTADVPVQLLEDNKYNNQDNKQLSVAIPSVADSDDSIEQMTDDWSYPCQGNARERRDSGVGSSLTRAASSGKRQKRARLRWHSFAKSHQTAPNSYDQPISNLSAGQLAVLRKLSLLKVTAALEKYSPLNKTNWSWFVPRLRRRSKLPDYSDRSIFGIPVAMTEQHYGQPLPQCILFAMRYLRRSSGDSVGIFRKPGVRMRVQTLRVALETDPDSTDFDGLSAYDVADLLKLYFRELPECLLTNKLSNVFISIFLYVPVDLRRDLVRLSLLLLPDEHRLVLQSLLLFLNDMAQHSQLHQMNASNLAVCFAPSLFHLCAVKSSSVSSPKQLQRHGLVPSEKDLVEQKVAHECLTYMIANVKSIFTVSEEMLNMCQLSYIEQGSPVPLEDLCRKYGKCDGGTYATYVDSCIQGVLKESREKFKGWISHLTPRGDVDLAYKKLGDGHPLRLWKFCVEVEAPPEEVLNRVTRERHLWDDDILKWRVVEKLDSQTEVFQYVLNSMAPHPTRDFSELRSWRTNLSRGMCILVSTSVEHANAPLMGDVRGVVLASRYLIEPCGSGKSRLTHIIRIDLRGHNPDWYNNVYGHLCANYAKRIRDSFKTSIGLTTGPETKV